MESNQKDLKSNTVGVYLRVSTDQQSVDMQMREITAFLENKGLPQPQIYQDEGMSGKSTNRPGLKTLLEDARMGRISIIVVWKLDRLFRSLSHLISTISALESYGVKFVAVRDQIDLTTSAGTLMMHMLGAFAQFERDLIAERTKAGLANAKAKGRKLGRPSKLGTNIAQETCQLHQSGLSHRRIALTLGISRGLVQRHLRRVG